MPPTQITNIVDLIEIAQELHQSFGIDEIWWRGQPKSNWKLVANVYRKRKRPISEPDMIFFFKTKARTRHANCPPDDDSASWLFLMQHYGLPTRLLDWTESPLIAAFFAVSQFPKSDSVIWALNPFSLNTSQKSSVTAYGNFLYGILGLDDKDVQFLIAQASRHGSIPEDKILAILTNEIDIRMLVQYSTFTLHGSSLPLDEFKDADKFLRQFTISAGAKVKLLKELHSVGIRAPNLFPDLEHLAKYLSNDLRYGWW